MRVITGLDDMHDACAAVRRAGGRLGFVPTMGYLHEGHVSLVAAARGRTGVVAMSVFVNPLQFGPAEDFARYPRDPGRDRALATSAGVELLWTPTAEVMYPEPPMVTVSPGAAGQVLEGAVRAGHFTGVLTVVLKLFDVVRPDVAVFGRKDVQQAALIRRMVRDLNVPTEIVVAPTVREADGLALSSRNVFLDAEARYHATGLARALARGVAVFRSGSRQGGDIVAAAAEVLDAEPGVDTDYVACVSPDDFRPVPVADEASILAVAARVGGARLIDNVILGEGLEGDVRLGR